MRLMPILLAATDPSAPDNLSTLDPVAAPADSIRDLFFLVTAICAVIFILVGGMLVYCIVRFRRQPGDNREPPQFYGSQPVELAWTLAPLLTCFVLFLVIIRYVNDVRRDEPPPNSLHITVRGHQWWWEYDYPEEGVKTANELHLPVNRPVFLHLESADVAHSFWIPRLSGKTDVIPGRTNIMWFSANRTGTFQGNCAEYCGTQHANMLLYAVVQSEDEFRDWVEAQKEEARTDSETRRGREVFTSHSCVNCHTIRDTGAAGTFGPDLTHVGSRDTLASAMVPNNTGWLTAWIRDPQQVKQGCWMPAFKLSTEDETELVRYLQSLK
jgi:cytochrome c oxidase subunit II